MRKRLLLLFWCLLLVISVADAARPGRGTAGVRPKSTTSGQMINPDSLYSASYALVIGASAYQSSGWPSLRGVLDDVAAVQTALEQQGFQVTTVMDPDRAALLKAFDDFINAHGLNKENRLLFYFAGHGYTDKTYWNEDMGYIVPVDAPNPLEDLDGFLRFGVNMQQIEVYAKNIRSKHALFVFDSCFSGSIFALLRGVVPPDITEKTILPVRQFLTSGSATEKVPDRSTFRQQFIEGLAGKADTNGDDYVTGTELGMFLQSKVIKYSRDTQHPQFGTINTPGLDEGDLVFQIPKLDPPDPCKQPSPPASCQPDRQLWDTWQAEMQTAFDNVFASNRGPAAQRIAWAQFLANYPDNNPYSQDDERLRAAAQSKLASVKDEPVEIVEPPTVVVPKRQSFEPEMVQITGGTFMMGSPNGRGESDEHPQHEVTVGDFAIGKYEVTQGEWQAVMGNNPSHFSSCGERCPVEMVSWNDVQDYIAKLNAKTGKTYRLPKEAEWEYACRGGAVGETYCGGNDVDSVAWYDGNSGSKTHPVGQKAANGFGLFDMTGNVREWTCSRYDSNGYSGKEATCANKGNSDARAVRGGSWGDFPNWVRAADRVIGTPSDRNYLLGFRLIQD